MHFIQFEKIKLSIFLREDETSTRRMANENEKSKGSKYFESLNGEMH